MGLALRQGSHVRQRGPGQIHPLFEHRAVQYGHAFALARLGSVPEFLIASAGFSIQSGARIGDIPALSVVGFDHPYH